MSKSEVRECQNCKQDFTIDSEDFDFYEKMKVPPPTWCWLCRAQRRLVFRNERYLYKRKSSFDGHEIFSMYAPDIPHKVYENSLWYSDKWDASEYAKEIDFSRPFLEQVRELLLEVPLVARAIISDVNSDYVNNATGPKNSYLIFNTTNTEDSMYSNGIDFSKDCVDVSHVSKCELCYMGFWLVRCNRTLYSSKCEDCTDVYFSKNLRGCSNCFGCTNLRGKNYYIFNKPYSKEGYFEKIKEFKLGSHSFVESMKKEAAELWATHPSNYIDGVQNIDVSGNYIFNSKNVKKTFLSFEGEDLKYCQYLQTPGTKSCYDYSIWGTACSFLYEVSQAGHGANNLRFCLACWTSVQNLEYCMFCQSSSNLFGCVGMRNKQYCILNKQYTKEEYEELVPKIIEHMKDMPYKDSRGRVYPYGEFFPAEFSPFAYNETVAQDHFPLTREEAPRAGYAWRDTLELSISATKSVGGLPDDIKDVTDDILKDIIECAHNGICNEQCTKMFRLIPEELVFYRKLQIPLPRLCPRCRTAERLSQRTKIMLCERKCMCVGAGSENSLYRNAINHFHGGGVCPNKFETSYEPMRKEIVYCEQCYQAEVV
ncbi:MAG TPA: hypothetical protein VJC20_00500 [Candidatus Paceibacterota bacterium]